MKIRDNILSFLNKELGAAFTSIQNISENNKYYFKRSGMSHLTDDYIETGYIKVRGTIIVSTVHDNNFNVLENIAKNANIEVLNQEILDDGDDISSFDVSFELKLDKKAKMPIDKVKQVNVNVKEASNG